MKLVFSQNNGAWDKGILKTQLFTPSQYLESTFPLKFGAGCTS